ncbi:nuclear nucleic acid-binding protein C1D-like [Ptychodera flava]|uniref:nuclear nucleic acid-binding protein C1D-like n=1 Tax=Ptychodera flava TaxID=63121 RepID=UPI00396A6F7C
MASDAQQHSSSADYPPEINEALVAFESSLQDIDGILKPLLETPLSDIEEKVTDPLERAKLDLVSAYSMNAMFWIYLTTQGINPKEHPIKQELDRIRNYMNKVKEITDKKKAPKLDKKAAARFIKSSLSVDKLEEKESSSGNPDSSKRKHNGDSKKKKKKKKIKD